MPNLTDLTVDFVSLVDRAAVRDPVQQNEPMRFLVWKRDNQTPKGALMKTAEELQSELTKSQDALAKAEADRATIAADLAKARTDIDELKRQLEDGRRGPAKKEEEAEINKADLDPAVRAYIEKQEAAARANAERAEKAEKTAESAETIAKAERDARLTREFVAKAESYRALPINKDEFGAVLKAAAEKLTKGEFEAIDTVLKAADEQIAKGELFKERGRSGDGPKPEGARAEVTTKAAELRKSDPRLTEAAAMQQVFKADPDLASRYQDEIRAA